jgi:eukaryotic-like serine/threonine-protein kinase
VPGSPSGRTIAVLGAPATAAVPAWERAGHRYCRQTVGMWDGRAAGAWRIFIPVTDTPPGALPTPYVPGMSGLTVMARGGYATVYRATQDSVGRDVAIKVENRTLDNPRDQARFLREAKAAGRMSSHPHVVDLFDVGVTVDQHPYLIMELCDGSYLDRMRVSPLGPAEARDLGVKIADALAHSHAAGVLHRDVKPANILYSTFNPAVLADFGLAVLGEMRDSSVTLEVLTPAYAPPEMFRHATPSPAVDVYALCATLYAVMRGRPPRWDGDHSPSLITLMDLFNQPIPDLPGVPPQFLEVLRYGMANEPRARPSAVQLCEMLSAVPIGNTGASMSGGPVNVYRSGTYRTPQLHPPASPTRDLPGPADDTPTVRTDRKRGRRKWLFGGFGAALVLALGAAGSWLAIHQPSAGLPRAAAATTSPPASTGRVPGAGGGISLPGCGAPLPGPGRCPDTLECLNRQLDHGYAAGQVPCADRHTWEVFALGTLPEGVSPTDKDAIRADATVRMVCSRQTFVQTTGLADVSGWTLSVLPPDPETSDRTFRCLAGRGTNALAGPTLTR